MTDPTRGAAIETMFLEERRYPPPEGFAAQANAGPEIYERDFDELWETEGRERVTWFEPFTKLYEWELDPANPLSSRTFFSPGRRRSTMPMRLGAESRRLPPAVRPGGGLGVRDGGRPRALRGRVRLRHPH